MPPESASVCASASSTTSGAADSASQGCNCNPGRFPIASAALAGFRQRPITGCSGNSSRYFKAAYDKFVEGGWTALDAPIEFGGQGLIRTRATPNDDGSYAIEGLEQATLWLAQNAPKDPEQAGAAATPYLRLMALTVIGYLWSRMAGVAGQQLEAGEGNKPLLESKQASARFYFEKLMPETDWLLKDIQSGKDSLMSLSDEHWVA